MKTDAATFQPDRATVWAAGAALTATLGFALVVFYRALPVWLEPSMQADAALAYRVIALLAVGGIAGALLAAWRFQIITYQRRLAHTFRGVSVAAVLLLVGRNSTMALMASLLLGLAFGFMLVTLLSGLRAALGASRLGRVLGIAVAGAVALAGAPLLAGVELHLQIVVAALLIGSASLSAPFLTPQEPSVSSKPEYRYPGLLGWAIGGGLLVGGALFVAARSGAAFTETDRAGTWALSAVAIVVAGLSGFVLDRGAARGLAAAAVAFLLAAVALGHQSESARWAALLAVAAGTVGTALILYVPARSGRAWLVALVVAVAVAALTIAVALS